MWPFPGGGWGGDPFFSPYQSGRWGQRQIGDSAGPDFGSGALIRSQQQGRGPASGQQGQGMHSRSQIRIGDGSRSDVGPGAFMRSPWQGNTFGFGQQGQHPNSRAQARAGSGNRALMGYQHQGDDFGFGFGEQDQGMSSHGQARPANWLSRPA